MKIHIVKQGDTLYQLAGKYGVTLEELLKLNPEIANPDQIHVGMKVKIPSNGGKSSEMVIAHQHVVQQGDTLWKLSKAWGVPLSDMIKANPQLKNPNVLMTGETVNIPKASGKETDLHLPEMPIMPELPAMPSIESPSGKTSTAPIATTPGKTSTAPIASMPGKTSTAPMPMPEVMPQATQQIQPVQEHHMYPIHLEYHKTTHLFQQHQEPAVKAGAKEEPKKVEPAAATPCGTYSPAAGMQYGMQMPVGGAGMSYGTQMPVGGAGMSYGTQMPVGGAEASYGGQMPAPGAVAQWPGIGELYGGYGYSYAAPQQEVSVHGMGYGGYPGSYSSPDNQVESTSVGADTSSGYGYPGAPGWDGSSPQSVMPAAWGQSVNPWGGGMAYGYGGQAPYGYPGMMPGAESMGYGQSMPNYYMPQAYGMPQVMGTSDMSYGAAGVGGVQTPGQKPCNCGCKDQREEEEEAPEVKLATNAPSAKRTSAAAKTSRSKKTPPRTAAKRPSRRQGSSLPWINN
ncbi:hypothetical protein PA598K_02224 [Paenibacillus sp. 598K]|uniref:LysM peptidoglycan-binding domain-containing protein n=1 Tax=Paenibacillus sp. 598K TaxID=1117987 RepID=UPI000FF99627|nr:LysM peptidoglycan-binding domain-containing protein [Paenibacillus sp. 598K]GBF73900.1 hypothetical protein PA598K_02224 [Paenibacillus sp. 598K]